MYISSLEGHQGIVEVLIKKNVELNQPCGSEQMTSLMAAVTGEHLKVVKMLIKVGSVS